MKFESTKEPEHTLSLKSNADGRRGREGRKQAAKNENEKDLYSISYSNCLSLLSFRDVYFVVARRLFSQAVSVPDCMCVLSAH